MPRTPLARTALMLLASASALTAAGAAVVLAAPERTAPVVPVAAVSVPAVDTGSRAAVAHLYRSVLAPALAIEPGWTGSVDGCRAGALSPAAQQATLTAVNVARRLAHLRPVRFDAALSAKAQQAALVFKAGTLTHDVAADAPCATAGARQAALASDIAAGTDSGASGAGAVLAYLAERSTAASLSVTAVAHRRWILNPRTAVMGAGSTDTTNALWVRGTKAVSGADPAWTSWPTAGWFPSPLEPGGRWSLSAGGAADFSAAKVVVRTSGGKRLAVHVEPVATGIAAPTLVFEVAGLKAPSGWHARSYTVAVTGIRRAGRTVSHRWTVHLFDPMTLVPTGTTRITRSGSVLTAHPGAFSPAATATAVRWTRGSVVVGTGTTYRLTAADRGRTLVATVTGVRARYTAGTATASLTVPR